MRAQVPSSCYVCALRSECSHTVRQEGRFALADCEHSLSSRLPSGLMRGLLLERLSDIPAATAAELWQSCRSALPDYDLRLDHVQQALHKLREGGLVDGVGRPARYWLTAAGQALARRQSGGADGMAAA